MKRRFLFTVILLAVVLCLAAALAEPTGNLKSASVPVSQNNQKGTVGEELQYTVTGVFENTPNWEDYDVTWKVFMGIDRAEGYPKMGAIDGDAVAVSLSCDTSGTMIGAFQFALKSELEEHGYDYNDCPSMVEARINDDAVFSDWAYNWDSKIASVRAVKGDVGMKDGESFDFGKLFKLYDADGKEMENDGGLNFHCEINWDETGLDMFAIEFEYKDEDDTLAITFNQPFPVSGYIDLPLIAEIRTSGKIALKEIRLYETTPPAIKLDKTLIKLIPNEEYQFTAKTNPEGQTVTWTSSDNAIATVGINGLVTAVGEGNCTICASLGNDKVATCEVEVTHRTISISDTILTLIPGQTHKLTATPNPADSIFTWESYNEEVATVDENGLVTAIKEGSAPIDAVLYETTSDGDDILASCVVYVLAPDAVTPTTRGDVNGDGSIDELDVIKLLRILVGLDEMLEDMSIANMDGNEGINNRDAVLLLKLISDTTTY